MVAPLRVLDTGTPAGVLLNMGKDIDIHALSDEELLLHSLKHPDAFAFLVARYQGLFLARASAVMRDRDDAEDVVQEAFVRIFRFAPRFTAANGTFKAWGMTVLMNVARTHWQRRAKHRTRTASLSQEHYESLPDQDRTDAIDAKDIIERALAWVSPDAATILRLAYIERVPYETIAQDMGLTAGAVKTRVHRAKKELKGVIGSIDI